jgi:glycerol-1-phosphate dehydrogenase [NAD(P)+]
VIGELRLGRHTLASGLSTAGRVLLVVAEPVRAEVVQSLDRPPEHVIVASTLERSELDALFAAAPEVDCIAGVGGGVAIDVAKYGALQLGLPVISTPTILSTTAYINPLSVLREEGRSVFVATPPPSLVLVDLDVLQRAPVELNVAGLGDILSCHTATQDWRLAVDDGDATHPWDAAAARQAQLLVESIAAHAADFRVMNERALKLLVDMHIEVVALCEEIGHTRPETGSEHLLAEAVEEVTSRSFLHGPIIGLGIDLMSELQDNDHDAVCATMAEIGLSYSPKDVGVSRPDLEDALRRLWAGAHGAAPWKSIVDYSPGLDDGRIAELLDRRVFA